MANANHIILSSPAKINLFLRITGKRVDGYHEIITFMQKITLADELVLEKAAKGIHLRCPDSDLPENEQNIAFRAARCFFENTACPGGVAITLKKSIPIAAGLGGGSSNAATVLKGLNKLLDSKLRPETLHRLARKLGADVPFFASEWMAAWATGIGDCLHAAEHEIEKWVVLVNPDFPVSTKWVYENFKLTTPVNAYIFEPRKIIGTRGYPFQPESGIPLFNDLESVTLARFPELCKIKDDMTHHGAESSLMSGSGATIFGLFSNKENAQACFKALLHRLKSSVFITKFLAPGEGGSGNYRNGQ